MKRLMTLEFSKEAFRFSIAHFTIFSSTERETLHGHNYYVAAKVSTEEQEPGVSFNYVIFKERLSEICARLHLKTLLAEKSPYLKFSEQEEWIIAHFNGEKIPFVKADVILLPVFNTTLEDLAQWFLDELTNDRAFIQEHKIHGLEIRVFNGPGQCAVVGNMGSLLN